MTQTAAPAPAPSADGGRLAAPSDMACWLGAAWPPGPHGQIPVARVAANLDVSTSTVRRWLADSDWQPTPTLYRVLIRRAVLRGHGSILWPDVDAVTVLRDAQAAAYAARAAETIRTKPLAVWVDAGWDRPHRLQVLWWPHAHVFSGHVSGPGGRHSVVSDTAGGPPAEIGEIKGAAGQAVLASATVYPSRHAAVVALHRLLETNRERRCVVPQSMVAQGRSHALRPARIIVRQAGPGPAGERGQDWKYRLDRGDGAPARWHQVSYRLTKASPANPSLANAALAVIAQAAAQERSGYTHILDPTSELPGHR